VSATPSPRLFSFVGGSLGGWSVVSANAIVGDPLPVVDRVDFVTGGVGVASAGAKWVLRGVTSNARYTTRSEKESLVKKQASLGRPASTLAALIPIRKSAQWWELTQDERREIFEERSRHTAVGLDYLPGVARRLHHCRDLGCNDSNEAAPFDFLTLFDYAPADAAAFDDLVAALRETPEWQYVEREVDIRLERVSS
jgi:chlorite dismutase